MPQQDGNKIAFDTADPIVQKARDELYKEIENEGKDRSPLQLEKEKGIDQARIALKNYLLKSYGFSTTTEQKIIMLENDDIYLPGIAIRDVGIAYASELTRLKNKRAVEQQQTPRQRQAQQIWKPLTQEETRKIARRKNMSAEEWETHLLQQEYRQKQEQRQ